MIRKIIASVLMFVLLSTSIANAYTPEDKTAAQDRLGEYSRYVPLLEKSLPKISTEKLDELEATLSVVINQSDGDMQDFLMYALISIDLEQQSRADIMPQSALTEAEKTMVQDEIMTLQDNIEDEMSSFLEGAIVGWNNAVRYEEKGNFKMFLDMAVQDFIQFEGKLDISNYISETQVFDQTFSGDVNTSYSTKVPGIYGGEVDFSLKTSADLIAKDGNIYIKLDNTSAQSQSSNEYFELDMTPYIEKLQELSKSNTYLEIPGDDIYGYMQGMNYTDITQGARAQMENAFSLPLLQATYKTDLGYQLIPTKHFCDIGKKISGIFDPFGGEDCTQDQYLDMLEDFLDSGLNINMTIDELSTLSMNIHDAGETVSMDISWNDNGVEQIKGLFTDSSSSYYGESHMSFDFMPEESFSMSAGDDSFDGSLSLSMDNNGAISMGEYSLIIEDDFNMQGIYRNKNMSVSMSGSDGDTSVICEFNGPLKKQFLDISGGCDIESKEITYDLPGVESIHIDSALSYDGRHGKNNMDMSLNISTNNDNYLDFSISNVGTRRSIAAKEIIAPTKTKDIEEFFDEIYDEIYSDYDYGYYDDYEYTSNEYDDYSEDCYTYDSGDSTCYKYYDDKTETCEYIAETGITDCNDYVYTDWEYEVEEFTFDDHTTTCYIYNNGNTTCYEYYEDKSVTCEYLTETGKTDCDTYEYGYKLIETETDEYTQTCYNYDNGDYNCYKYYDDKEESCFYYAESDELDCNTYEYDDYYYTEDAQEAIEDSAE
ncbi:hypothetical protein LR010_02640 [Candidatus Gracilibacteria bacterium]|nr:hypothetical protein [Candidatus Gracilibacteria bacterium]